MPTKRARDSAPLTEGPMLDANTPVGETKGRSSTQTIGGGGRRSGSNNNPAAASSTTITTTTTGGSGRQSLKTPKPTKMKIDTPFPKGMSDAFAGLDSADLETTGKKNRGSRSSGKQVGGETPVAPTERTTTIAGSETPAMPALLLGDNVSSKKKSAKSNSAAKDAATAGRPSSGDGRKSTGGRKSNGGGGKKLDMSLDDDPADVDGFVAELNQEGGPEANNAGGMREGAGAVTSTVQIDPLTKKAMTQPHKASEVSVFTTTDINPYTSGVASMALSGAEDAVAIAREDGSILIFDIVKESSLNAPVATKDMHKELQYTQRTPEHFVFRAATGGKEGSSIVKLVWANNDTFLLATFFSGQILQYHAATLEPISLHPRNGGAIWDFTWSEDMALGFAAVADGQIHVYQLRGDSDRHVEFVRTFPKISGSNRCLTVCYSHDAKLLCGGDDGRNIVGWEIGTVEQVVVKRQSIQKFVAKIPEGNPLSSVIVPEEQSVAVGTSMNDVIFIDSIHGSILKIFSHHKGPVVCLATVAGMVYATGWHELLRAYRVEGNKKNNKEWYPAETKRRTHYHEASALVVGSKSKLLLSAARDGTIMHSSLAKLFSKSSLYFDATNDRQFDAQQNVLVKGAGKDLELFKFDLSAGRVSAWMRMRLQTHFFIKGVWLTQDAQMVAVATDDRLRFLNIDHDRERLTSAYELAVGSVSHVAFHDTHDLTFIAAGTKVHWLHTASKENIEKEGCVDLGVSSAAITSLKVCRGSAQDVLVIGTRSEGMFTLRLSSESGVPFGGPSKETTLRGVTNISSSLDEGHAVARTNQGFFKVTPSTNTKPSLSFPAPKSELEYASKLPLNSTFLHQQVNENTTAAAGSSSSSTGGLLAFPRGLVYADKSQYHHLLKAPIVYAGTLTAPHPEYEEEEEEEGEGEGDEKDKKLVAGAPVAIVLKRNVEAIVRELPEMWRVRRFAN